MSEPSVLIVGAGYAGRALASRLDAHADVTVLTERDAFLHNVAALRAVAVDGWAEQLMISYDAMLHHGTVRQATVAAIDDSGVELEDGTRLTADYIVIATGSSYPYPGKPTETSTAALVDRYTRTRTALTHARNVVILGAGPVGIELAGEIAAAHPHLAITLVDPADELLPGPYKATLRERIHENLSKAGVMLVLGDAPADVPVTDDAGIRSDHTPLLMRSGRTIPADLVLPPTVREREPTHWHPSTTQSTIEAEPRVDTALRVIGHPRLLAVGDVTDIAEPKQAVAAEKHAKVAAATISALAAGRTPTKSYRPAKVHPIVLPQGPAGGAAQLPVAGGLVVGAGPTKAIKGKALFGPRYQRLLKAKQSANDRP